MCAAAAVRIVELSPISTATPDRARAAMPKASCDGQRPATLYLYAWNRCGRKGQACNLLARGTMNSCLLEFEDGFRMVTSRNALRRLTPRPNHDEPDKQDSGENQSDTDERQRQ